MCYVRLLVGCLPVVFTGSDMPINLLSADHGNAQNVRMPGILVVGEGVWRGVGALKVTTRFSVCSFCYVWVSQETVTIVLWATFLLFSVG